MIASTFFIARPTAFYDALRFGNVSSRVTDEKKYRRAAVREISPTLILRSSGLLLATTMMNRHAERALNDTINIEDRRVVVCATRLAYDSPRYVAFRDPMN
jgi:hypothetical protein